tara:strand:- start:41 stop:574 length:534 start_codon:yes stop_codon:yes gene_type:complete
MLKNIVNSDYMEFIYELDNVVPNEYCEELIKSCYNRSSKEELDKILNFVIITLESYLNHLKINDIDKNTVFTNIINTTKIGAPNMYKTTVGGFDRWHYDSTIIKNSRLFTYIIYLNDMEEGSGGTTDFSCGKISTPKAGKVLLFPTDWTYLNRCKKVEKGERYILKGFVMSEIPEST